MKIRPLKNLVPAIIVVSCVLIYIASMIYLTFLKYYTFHATYLDLGLENQVLWILSHGGITNYYSSGFAHFYPLQFEQPFMFLVLPIYMAFPSPYTLLTIQTIALGLVPIPIYLSMRIATGYKWTSVVVAISVLVYFPVISANIFDYHIFSFLPLFYMLMVLYWLKGNIYLTVLFSILAAMINPLALLLVIFFMIYVSVRMLSDSLMTHSRPVVRGFIPYVAVIVCLLSVLYIYHILNHVYIPGGMENSGLSLTQLFFFNINEKLTLILFLFGALAFIPLFEPVTLFLVTPYVGYVLLSDSSSLVSIFGIQYTSFAIGPLYLGILLFMWRLSKREHLETPVDTMKIGFGHTSFANRVVSRYEKPLTRVLILFVIMVMVFSVIYLPFSPVNNNVSGGYFKGHYQYSEYVTVTPEVQFLHKTINLIPKNASVITQHNIPELSSRQYLKIIKTNEDPTLGYEYILVDTSINYFTDSGTDLSYAINAYSNGHYGIYAEGMGALLLKENYTGTTVLFSPYSNNMSGRTFATFGSSYYSGNNIVSANGSAPGFIWYGPYMTLAPGEYKAVYILSMNGTGLQSSSNISLQVYNDPTFYAKYVVLPNELNPDGKPTEFPIYFNLTSFATKMQFRGIRTTNEAQITFYGIVLIQLNP